ncbi:MAG: hypothetical protein ABSG07_12590 [Terriglobales bacterium]
MKTLPVPSKPVNLRDAVHQHLHMYALAASAAGVSMLAMARPGVAEIVYTPTHHHIVPNHTFHLDLNGDGTTDFKIHDFFTYTSFGEVLYGALSVRPAQAGNEVLGYAAGNRSLASALRVGVRIESTAKFSPNKRVMASGDNDSAGADTSGFCTGPWKNVRNRFLGLKFMISGEVHYGWARLTETCITQGHGTGDGGENSALLTGYAYETVPNKGIVAGRTKGNDDEGLVEPVTPTPISASTPSPATLGVLAQGSRALSVWRQKQSAPEGK